MKNTEPTIEQLIARVEALETRLDEFKQLDISDLQTAYEEMGSAVDRRIHLLNERLRSAVSDLDAAIDRAERRASEADSKARELERRVAELGRAW